MLNSISSKLTASFMNVFKHIKRFFKSVNKRVIQPIYVALKPAIRFIKNDPYEIRLLANKQFQNSDFVVAHNVIDYEFYDFNSWKIRALSPTYENGIKGLSPTSVPIFIVIDTKFHEAFGHWFFESAIWLPTIKVILDQFPSAKIHLKESKGYKTKILNYFDISADRISNKIDGPSNLCIFINPCTSLNDSSENNRFKDLLYSFSKYFHQTTTSKKIDFLLMPRQKRENFVANDRQVNTDDLELFFSNMPSCEIFNTDTSPTFSNQISIIQASKHLVVTDGSAFLVNAFLAQSTVVFVLGDTLVPNQRCVQEKTRIICEYIEHNNAVMYLQSSDNVFTRKSLEQWFEH